MQNNNKKFITIGDFINFKKNDLKPQETLSLTLNQESIDKINKWYEKIEDNDKKELYYLNEKLKLIITENTKQNYKLFSNGGIPDLETLIKNLKDPKNIC